MRKSKSVCVNLCSICFIENRIILSEIVLLLIGFYVKHLLLAFFFLPFAVRISMCSRKMFTFTIPPNQNHHRHHHHHRFPNRNFLLSAFVIDVSFFCSSLFSFASFASHPRMKNEAWQCRPCIMPNNYSNNNKE